jgi:murein L,D-transpeptidase YcbB/YkuD
MFPSTRKGYPSFSRIASATLLSLLVLSGCHRMADKAGYFSGQPKGSNLPTIASRMQALVTAGQLSSMRWQNFPDLQPQAKIFYQEINYQPAWVHADTATPQANAMITAFTASAAKGFDPKDFGGPRWADRIAQLHTKLPDAIAEFDVAMTVSAMRYIAALHNGRVNPEHVAFSVQSQGNQYDLPQFLAQQVVNASDLPSTLGAIEPQSEGYRRTEAALAHYLLLAQQDKASSLPQVSTTIKLGGHYAYAQQLHARLLLLGDAPPDDATQVGSPGIYDSVLANAVRHFQHRHGLAEDGMLTPATLTALNVPLWQRVRQLQDSIERWRWLPADYVHAPLMINLPEFVLRAYSPDQTLAFKMDVIVGRAIEDRQTPVFTNQLKYIIFRPYWNVPVSIAKKEILPHLKGNPHYLTEKHFEVVRPSGEAAGAWNQRAIESQNAIIREKPGPHNSLGLAKFVFPNTMDIYLHGTSDPGLFSHSQRDLSHGCIRVRDPAKLAAWLLRDQPQWPLEKIQEAMNNGRDSQQVNLKNPVAVVIFYSTVMVEDDGEVHFFNDIYAADSLIESALSNGYPYASTMRTGAASRK